MKTLLQAEGTVTPSCSTCHITYTIHLHHDCRELHVKFDYDPKKLEDEARAKALIEDALPQYILAGQLESSLSHWRNFLPLQNLLTLSFDDENGFRGAGHRHDPHQHMIISVEEASPGLVPGIFPRGQLKLMINVHSVITEQCSYYLHVWEGEDSL